MDNTLEWSTLTALPFPYGLPRFSLKYTKEAPYGEALHNTKEVLKEDKMILMNLTETWLDSTIEGLIEIEGYNIFRDGRKNRERSSSNMYT